MKKISLIAMAVLMGAQTCANAAYSDSAFRREMRTGLDIVGARANARVVPDAAPGEMGAEVYQSVGVAVDRDVEIFVPTSMYVRLGGGLNMGFATDRATFGDSEYDADGGYAAEIGLGWNLSSYVRTEIDFQTQTLKFADLKNYDATYNMLNAMLYFDFARRYVQTGDITHRRRFVPFMGIGAGAGMYRFDGANGADGFVIGAPRAELGFNIMLNEFIGVDIAWQYQMMIGNGYGWGGHKGGVSNVNNLMASFRANF